MTCSQLVHNLFMTCSRLVHNLFSTCSWLVQDLITTFSPLPYNLFMTCYGLVQSFFTTFWQLVNDLFTTSSKLVHYIKYLVWSKVWAPQALHVHTFQTRTRLENSADWLHGGKLRGSSVVLVGHYLPMFYIISTSCQSKVCFDQLTYLLKN